MRPARLIVRLFMLSAVVAVVMLAVVSGCATQAKLGKAPPEAKDSNVGYLDPDVVGGFYRSAAMAAPSAQLPADLGTGGIQNQELWVIEKPRKQAAQQQQTPGQLAEQNIRQNDIPGSGQLVAKQADQKLVPVPLQHTDVKASIAGYIATVDVTQRYANPYSEKIEAIYVFPLPTNAAVNEFLMTIGDRKIRGIIREREEAKQIYDAAKRQGYVASLLTQERPNVFTQSIANIEPGKKIDVDIKYFHTLEYVDGWYEYVFPMVVGPRFNPPGSSDGVGAKAHDAPYWIDGSAI